MKQTSIIGIGNILLKDEGFGVRVIEGLKKHYDFPENVQVLDGGTLGMDLLPFIKGSANLLIIDAINGGDIPGTVYCFSGDEVEAYFQNKVSLHELGIKDLLAVLKILDDPVEKVVIIGVQPQKLELGMELTPVVADQLIKVENAVISQLKDWQIEVKISD